MPPCLSPGNRNVSSALFPGGARKSAISVIICVGDTVFWKCSSFSAAFLAVGHDDG